MDSKLGREMMKLGCTLIVVALAAVVAGGCRTPTGPRFDPRQAQGAGVTNLVSVDVTNRIDAAWLQPPEEPFTLGPGDRLEIEVFGEPNTRATVVVGPDGKIYYYLLPGLNVWGLTLPETRELIQNELAARYYRNGGPQVGITLRGVESKRVWLLGRLANSGIYLLQSPTTLLEAVSLAGGIMSSPGAPGDVADLNHSFVIRDGRMLPVNFEDLLRRGDMSQNIYLRSGDFVYVPSAGAEEVYVLGAVRIPKPVEVVQRMTLVAAIAQAGGTIKDAYLSHVAVVRGSLSEPKIAVIDYEAIIEGKASDVVLQPRDIVYVPFTPYRTLVRYADLILQTFVRAVAINEGARAVSDEVLPVGVNIGITTE